MNQQIEKALDKAGDGLLKVFDFVRVIVDHPIVFGIVFTTGLVAGGLLF